MAKVKDDFKLFVLAAFGEALRRAGIECASIAAEAGKAKQLGSSRLGLVKAKVIEAELGLALKDALMAFGKLKVSERRAAVAFLRQHILRCVEEGKELSRAAKEFGGSQNAVLDAELDQVAFRFRLAIATGTSRFGAAQTIEFAKAHPILIFLVAATVSGAISALESGVVEHLWP